MKTRFFLITLFAPFALYFLAAQAALTTWNLFSSYDDAVGSLELAVMLDDSVSVKTAGEICLKVEEITGRKARVSSPDEQMERFSGIFGVDIMEVLADNPFPSVVISSIGRQSDPLTVKSALLRMQGVNRLAYPDDRRSEIMVSYNDRCIKMTILDTILALVLLLQVWMAERLEDATNEHLMAGVPYKVRRRTFHRRSFIRGTVSGILAAGSFLFLRSALQMNPDVLPDVGSDRCLAIACAVVVTSSLLSYFMQLAAFPIANRNSR